VAPPLPLEFQGARSYLLAGRPYLAQVLFAMTVRAVPGLGTLAVDARWRLYYDPEAVADCSARELATLLLHETWHCLRDHHARAKALSVQGLKANIAQDAAINCADDFGTEKYPWPKKFQGKVVLPKNFKLPDHLTWEEYYAQMPDFPCPACGGGNGEGHKSGKSHAPTCPSSGKPSVGQGNCGSCAAPERQPWEEQIGGTDGRERQEDGVPQFEQDLIRRDVARQVQEAAKNRGTVPAGLLRWAEELLSPQVDWRRELRACVRHGIGEIAGLADYTYRRPARRQSACPRVILPSLRQPIPRIAVVVDTSGSMGSAELGHALAEVRGVLRASGVAEVRVLSCDAAVHQVQRVWGRREIELLGGGGTDMVVGIEAAARLKPPPGLVICISDGYTPWPAASPDVPVVIGLVGESDHNAHKEVPPWARVVHIAVNTDTRNGLAVNS